LITDVTRPVRGVREPIGDADAIGGTTGAIQTQPD
jgi:hypothetical protein